MSAVQFLSSLAQVLSLYWLYPLIFLSYYVVDLAATRKLVSKNKALPLVGCPSSLTPRVVLNLVFARNAAQIFNEGYTKVHTWTLNAVDVLLILM